MLFKNKYTILIVLTLTLTIGLIPSVRGEFETLPKLDTDGQLLIDPARLSGQFGNLLYGPIFLDGRPIFYVAVPASISQDKAQAQQSLLEQRIKRIENTLREIIKRNFDPNTLQVNVSTLNGETVIVVSDQKNLKQIVGTVTQSDAQLYGESIEKIGIEATKILYSALLKADQERQPEYLQEQFIKAIEVFLVILILSILILNLQKILTHRLQQIRHYLMPTEEPTVIKNKPNLLVMWINRILDYLTFPFYFYSLKSQFKKTSDLPINLTNFMAQPAHFLSSDDLKVIFQKQVKSELLLRRLLLLGMWLIWVQGISCILFLFPDTRKFSIELAGTPMSLLAIWAGVTIGNKIVELIIDWALNSWTEVFFLTQESSQRKVFRISTLASALRGVSGILLFGIGIILSLQAFKLPVTPILAGAGILGFAISFGSQSIIKDMISGAINLMNDSYAIGDIVTIGSDSGLVEDLNLFVTRIRSANGDLVTIPNGLVGIVRNQTKDWSRVDYQIQVSYETDARKALQILREVAHSLYSDPEWQKFILEPPELRGIENLSYEGITLRIWLKTEPGKQWIVAYEFRLRLKEEFQKLGIEIGIPKQSISMYSARQ